MGLEENWEYRQLRSCVVAAQSNQARRGVMSTGERLAVALILNRADWLAEENYTIADAVARVGEQWMEFVRPLSREFRNF